MVSGFFFLEVTRGSFTDGRPSTDPDFSRFAVKPRDALWSQLIAIRKFPC